MKSDPRSSIAEAELLAALKKIRYIVEGRASNAEAIREVHTVADAAISKAEGR